LALQRPPADLSKLKVKAARVAVSKLFRISRHDSGEPYFGRSAGNRFDAPDRSYGTCYCGFDLQTAIAETVLHDAAPRSGVFEVTQYDLDSRYLMRFTGGVLNLAVLYGASAKALAGDGSISTVLPYDIPQEWSAALHAHPDRFDGILYMSRHVNDRKAAVLFDMAKLKFSGFMATPLPKVRSLGRVQAGLGIKVLYP
jgi:hypothetical protein